MAKGTIEIVWSCDYIEGQVYVIEDARVDRGAIVAMTVKEFEQLFSDPKKGYRLWRKGKVGLRMLFDPKMFKASAPTAARLMIDTTKKTGLDKLASVHRIVKEAEQRIAEQVVQ